jgi:hypothetical protein
MLVSDKSNWMILSVNSMACELKTDRLRAMAIGAAVNRSADAQSLLGPVMLLLMAPSIAAVANPGDPLLRAVDGSSHVRLNS